MNNSWLDAATPVEIRRLACDPPLIDRFTVPGDALALAALAFESMRPDIFIAQRIAQLLPPRPRNFPVECRRTHLRSIRADAHRRMGLDVTADVWKRHLAVECLLGVPSELASRSAGGGEENAAGDVIWSTRTKKEADEAIALTTAAAVSGCNFLLRRLLSPERQVASSVFMETMRLAAFSGAVETVQLAIGASRQKRLLQGSHIPVTIAIAILVDMDAVWRLFDPRELSWTWANAHPSCLRNHRDFFVRRGEHGVWSDVVPFVEFTTMTFAGLRRLEAFLVPWLHDGDGADAAPPPFPSHLITFTEWMHFFAALCIHRGDATQLRDAILARYSRWFSTQRLAVWALNYGMSLDRVDFEVYGLLFPPSSNPIGPRASPSGNFLAIELLEVAERNRDARLVAELRALIAAHPAMSATLFHTREVGGLRLVADAMRERNDRAMMSLQSLGANSGGGEANEAGLVVAAAMRLLDDDICGCAEIARGIAETSGLRSWRNVALPMCGPRVTIGTYLRVLEECGYDEAAPSPPSPHP